MIYHCPEHAHSLQHNGEEALLCPEGCVFPVRNGIPRFVLDDEYAASFGLQWNTFRKTQLDSYTKTTISGDRLHRILGDFSAVRGKIVLEAGCGSGRFSEVLLQEGANLISFDLSNAVDAARENCASFPGHDVCQASILRMPFSPESFDVVICIGVVQHTPNPEETVAALARMVRPGGALYIDHYAPGYPMPFMRGMLRRFLLRKDPAYCMRFCSRLRNLLWPIHVRLRAWRGKRFMGAVYAAFTNFSPLVDYQDVYPSLPPVVLREWAMLDTHDLLTDVYKHLRTTDEIRAMLGKNGLAVTRCEYAGNGVEAAAVRPLPGSGA